MLVAAEMSLPVWKAWEVKKGLPDLASKLIECFLKWRDGKVSANTLKRYCSNFRKVLPRDLRSSKSPYPGLAGWALLTVPMIALERCGNVHDDWLWSGILDATCATTSGVCWVDCCAKSRLSKSDLLFLARWWDECNPSNTVPVDPGWLKWNGGTIAKLAESIYDERRFQGMPILADALEEAGCTDQELLRHCRRDEPHVLGCWALDLLLGKE